MNTENLDRLIEAIEKENLTFLGHDVIFDMGQWVGYRHKCHTFACIGGHCEILSLSPEQIIVLDEESPSFGDIYSPYKLSGVVNFLGISEVEASRLCYMKDFNGDYFVNRYEEVDSEHALKVLRHLRETGKVDWSVAGLPPFQP